MTTMPVAMSGGRVARTTLRRWLAVMAEMARRELRRRQEIAWLMQQDDRMLTDLGLSRCDIARVVRYGREG